MGGTATFDVSVTGTAPFVYQWRRNGTNLTGQTATSLVLSNLTVDSAGNFAVVISNRVSAITSAPVSLTITSAPPLSYRGIYTGQFAGEADAGGFAVMVGSNQTGVVVGYNTVQGEGVYKDGFVVSSAGGFDFVDTEGGQVSGTFTSGGISGQFTNSLGVPGGFDVSCARLPCSILGMIGQPAKKALLICRDLQQFSEVISSATASCPWPDNVNGMRNIAPISDFPPTRFSPNRSPIYEEAHLFSHPALEWGSRRLVPADVSN